VTNSEEAMLGFMRTLIAVILTAGLALTLGCETERGPATVEWRGYTLQEARSLADLPTVIQSGLGAGRPGLDGVADRGRPFNMTDVVNASLPMRRFIVAGRQGDTWLVALEHGGIGYGVEVFLFSALDATPKQTWILLDRPRTLTAVIQSLAKEYRKVPGAHDLFLQQPDRPK